MKVSACKWGKILLLSLALLLIQLTRPANAQDSLDLYFSLMPGLVEKAGNDRFVGFFPEFYQHLLKDIGPKVNTSVIPLARYTKYFQEGKVKIYLKFTICTLHSMNGKSDSL